MIERPDLIAVPLDKFAFICAATSNKKKNKHPQDLFNTILP